MAKIQMKLTLQGDTFSRAYLFKQSGTGNWAPRCLISSHGWFTAASGVYTPPVGVRLHFFCNHLVTLDDVGNAREAINGAIRPIQTITAPANCTDYTLGKLQEHKADIKAFVKKYRKVTNNPKAKYAEASLELGGLGGGETYEWLKAQDTPNFDLVTVRNRSVGEKNVTLNRLITAISAVHAYADFDCVFCREQK